MGLTQELAKFAVETTYNDLPREVVEKAKRIVLETVASQVLGSACALGKTMAEVLQDGPPEAMLIGIGGKRSLRTAAFYNTAIADTNDAGGGTTKGTVHHSKNVVPVGLTVASCKQKGGKELITAIVVALECYIRIDTLTNRDHMARGHYCDGTVGTIGTTIAAGKLFGIDQQTMQAAIGNGGMLAPCTVGGRSMFKSSGRPLTMGEASANGILAVTMAQAGIEGPHDILECPGGFCQALSGSIPSVKAVRDLGKIWLCLDNYYKPFTGCALTFIFREGARILKEKHKIKPEDIEKVSCRMFAPRLVTVDHYPDVGGNIVDHSCSLPYLMAELLMYDETGPACLSEERMRDPKVHELALRIECVPDPEIGVEQMDTFLLAKGYEERLNIGSLEIMTKGGEKYSYCADFTRPHAVKWSMTDAELKDKLREYAFGILSQQRIEQVIETIFKLEAVDNTAELMNLLAKE